MTDAKQFRAIKGVRDILPPDSALWNWFESTARRVMESYGFAEIRLPIFEETELFARSIGADTDVVAKEMYTFRDRGSGQLEYLRQSLLRPLATGEEKNFIKRVKTLRDEIKERIKEGISQADDRFASIDATLSAGLADVGDEPRTTSEQWLRFRNNVGKILESLEWPGQQITLRPEATASVIRAYIEHGMHTNPGLTKLYYIGPMFRRERPQKGRYRQFYQIGAEVLGQSDAPAIDAEVIEMLTALLGECGIAQWTLLVNSVGDKNCRPKYVETLRAALQPVKTQMCGDCQRRAETNPLRVLDCKVPADQPIIATLPKIADHLCAECRAHFDELQRQLALREIPYTLEPRLVRGLDYYMRTTFEITSPVLGAQNALVGGGRYDGLAELLGGPPTKGIGFALGTDRFIDAIQAAGKVKVAPRVDVFVAWLGGATSAQVYPVAVRLARKLRAAGANVELPPEEMKLKKAMALADKLGARYALLIGENEIASGKFTLRRMSDGAQEALGEGELLKRFATTDEHG